jgi:RND family efflux transporter MFP subunit
MKNWKLVTGVVFALAVIVVILVMNKKKLATATSGTANAAYYVSVDKVQRKDLSSVLSLTGTITAYNDVNIMSETSGKVTAVYTKVGDYKTAGSVLFQVDDELKRAAFMSAEANYEKSKKDYQRFQDLFKQNSATDAQLDAAKLGASMAEAQYIVAKRQLEDSKIKTPISGIVTARNVDLGSMVQAAPQSTLVANVVDISRLKVKLNVGESDAFLIKTGDEVNVSTDVYPGVIFKGKIESISSKSDEVHTYPVEIEVANQSAHQLRAGVFARIEFISMKNRNVLLIPREALLGSVKAPQLYVIENSVAKIRNITVGNNSGTSIEVVSGLSEGETIVTNGQNNLVDNVKVQILNK